jgi:hypothetical protein
MIYDAVPRRETFVTLDIADARIEKYRSFAEECERQAAKATDKKISSRLRDAAQTWRELAARLEKYRSSD